MAEPKVTWRGSKELVRTKRPSWNISQEKATCTLTYEGPYELCQSKAPFIGASIAGFEKYNLRVNSFELDPGEGSKGILTIHLENPQTGGGTDNSFGIVGKPLPEVQWESTTAKIETHHKCGKLKKGQSLDGNGHIPDKQYDPTVGGWTEQEYRSLIEANVTQFEANRPILVLIIYSYNIPSGFGAIALKIEDPPAGTPKPVTPPGCEWKWLRQGDELSRDEGKWRLVQRWRGLLKGTAQDDATILLYS